HVFEALLNTPAESQTLEEEEVLEERWIKEVVTRSGMKYRWARLAQEKERENRDASRRVLSHVLGVVSLCVQGCCLMF
ncbi:unnamed protein product, partial [Arctogadus glacialis]